MQPLSKKHTHDQDFHSPERHTDRHLHDSIRERARICRLMGMEEAVNLDGGCSSTLWNKDLGTISHPSGNRKFDHNGERIVPNIIAAF